MKFQATEREREREVYRTSTIGELMESLKQSKDLDDVRLALLRHSGPTLNFSLAALLLGATPTELLGMDKGEDFETMAALIAQKIGAVT